MYFGENWISVSPHGRLRQDPRGDPAGRRRLSRPPPGPPDLPQRTRQRGAHRHELLDRGAHLRPGPRRDAREGDADRERSYRERPPRGRHVPDPSLFTSCRTSRWSSTSPRHEPSAGSSPGDIRRQSSTLMASEEVGDLFYGGKAYDVHVVAHPLGARQRERRAEPSAWIPIGPGPAAGRRRRSDGADAERHLARAAVARTSTSAWMSRAATVAAVVDDVEDRQSERFSFSPGRITRRCSANPPSSTLRRTAAALRDRRRSRDLPPAPRRIRGLPAGALELPAVAHGAGRRGDRRC